jgi:hypothetical protein
MSEFVRFDETDSSGKTRRWEVVPVRGGTSLGVVKWYSPWRRYTFFPITGSLFDAACLDNIRTFLTEQMTKRGRP